MFLNLTSDIIHGFTESLLKGNFDNPQPTPDFHKKLWELCCLDAPLVAAAAPRGHAKSTSVTHAFTLALVLFRERSFGMIISDTEMQAEMFLQDIANELKENMRLREMFAISHFVKDTNTDIIVAFTDGQLFRILAKGSGQKVRGTKWNNKRPDFVVCDDLENEDIVLNKDTREKFRNWFFGSVIPMVSDNGIIRFVGTILHMDSLLERILNDNTWISERFRAHNEDFSDILWPEKFSKEKLLQIRKRYVNQGFPEGYAQEYLNHPIDESTAYFKREQLEPIVDYEEPLNYYAAIDFAISQSERADFTVIVVAGVSPSGMVKIVDCRRGRWDSLDIIEEMLAIQVQYSPEIFTAEKGSIEKAIGPFLNAEMHKKGVYINLNPVNPDKDKMKRARSISARMKAHGVQFDVDASWYPDMESELLRFPKDAHDDIVDALSWIGLTLDKLHEADTFYETEEAEWEEEFGDELYSLGRNQYTGY